VRAEVSVPAQVDEVTVQLIAGRSLDDGAMCNPGDPLHFPLTGAASLPIVVDVLPGATYAALVGYRVAWLRGGVEVDHLVGRVPWPQDGALEMEASTDAACLAAACAETANCRAGTCVPLAGVSPFDPSQREPGAQDCVVDMQWP
jgi:hypothetical protein